MNVIAISTQITISFALIASVVLSPLSSLMNYRERFFCIRPLPGGFCCQPEKAMMLPAPAGFLLFFSPAPAGFFFLQVTFPVLLWFAPARTYRLLTAGAWINSVHLFFVW